MSEPKKARVLTLATRDGWWYEHRHGITVVVELQKDYEYVGTAQVRITRRHLKDWIKRTEPKRGSKNA